MMFCRIMGLTTHYCCSLLLGELLLMVVWCNWHLDIFLVPLAEAVTMADRIELNWIELLCFLPSFQGWWSWPLKQLSFAGIDILRHLLFSKLVGFTTRYFGVVFVFKADGFGHALFWGSFCFQGRWVWPRTNLGCLVLLVGLTTRYFGADFFFQG